MKQWNVLWSGPAGSDGWRRAHAGKLGSNDIASIMGVGIKSAFSVWSEATGKAGREDISALPWIRRGVLLEPVVGSLFTSETGRVIMPTPGLIQHPELPYVAVTPDGLLDDGDAVWEAKTVGLHRRHEWDEGMPLRVQVQLQAMLWTLGLERGTAGAFCLDAEESSGDATRTGQDPLLLWQDMPRHDKVIEVFGNKVVDFYEKHVLKDIPPDPEGDVEAVKRVWRESQPGKVCDLPAQMESAIIRDAEIAAQITALEKEKRLVRAPIMVALGDAEYGRTPGGLLVRYATESRKGYVVEPTTLRRLIRVKKINS